MTISVIPVGAVAIASETPSGSLCIYGEESNGSDRTLLITLGEGAIRARHIGFSAREEWNGIWEQPNHGYCWHVTEIASLRLAYEFGEITDSAVPHGTVVCDEKGQQFICVRGPKARAADWWDLSSGGTGRPFGRYKVVAYDWQIVIERDQSKGGPVELFGWKARRPP